MREYDELDAFFQLVSEQIKEKEEASNFARYFYAACFKGKSTFYQKKITETQIFDDEWIKTIESFIPSIDAIIRNPRVAIQYQEEVVAIEKAKKTNSASVRHLSSHTQLIKNVVRDRNGDAEIQPKKILTTYADEMIATYENRFIMTLIDKLFLFVRRRYDVIQQHIRSYQKDHMVYETHFKLNDADVDANFDMSIERDLDDEKLNQRNKDLLKRVQYLMDYTSSFKNSAFMKRMAEEKAKRVIPPIMKTNVILKNVDFRNAYMLWLFLDHYYKLGFDVEIREKNVKLGDNFGMNLHRLTLLTYSMVMNNLEDRKLDFVDLPDLKPTVKKSTKIALTRPEEVTAAPHAVRMEDGLINEYYLQENKKVFNNKLKELVEQEMSDSKALKKAIADTLDISDQLYQTIFFLKEDKDYFELMTSQVEDPQKDYDDCMFKINLAKSIRDAKEASYKKSIKLEQELVKKMLKASELLVKAKMKQKEQEALKRQQEKIDKEIKKFNEQKKINRDEISYLEGRKVDIQTNKSQLQVEFDEMKQKVDEQTARIKEQERIRIEALLAEVMKKHELKMTKLRATEIAKLKIAKEHQQARLQAEKDKVNEQIKAAREEEKARTAAIIAKQKALNAAKEQKYADSIDKKVEKINNQTLSKLDEINQKAQAEIEAIKENNEQ